MDEMPVVHGTVVGRVLAHGRDDDSVGQRDAAEVQWLKEEGFHARDSIRNNRLHTGVNRTTRPGVVRTLSKPMREKE